MTKIKKFLKKNELIRNLYVKYLIQKKIKVLHTQGYEMLDEISKELSKTNLTAFAAFGTMLGLVRDKSFIKNDYDIDFGIVQDENFSWDKLKLVTDSLGMKQTHEFRFDNKIITEKSYTYKGIQIDFFLYFLDKNQTSMYCYIYTFKPEEKPAPDKVPAIWHPMLSPCPLVKNISLQKINNANALIPENAEEYLADIYGKTWKVPDPNYVHDEHDQLLEHNLGYYTEFPIKD